MGCVYRAAHVHMRKAVALKVLHREMTYMPEVVARFEREAVAVARIEHPNVAAAMDFGSIEDGAFYLVLEYVEGRSLASLLREGGSLAVRRALHVARQIADALAAAHAAGIVHRDLKPDNVMLIERDGDPDFVKVLDFGIAKVRLEEKEQQTALTQIGSIFGTPQYMAPEQAAGQPVDVRADLYTLGLILYEMLTGKNPFNEEDVIVVLTRQMTVPPPALPPHVDKPVSDLVLKLLKKAPAERFQTARDLTLAIDAVLSGSITPGPVVAAESANLATGDTVLSVARPDLPPASAQPVSVAASSARAVSQVLTRLGPLALRVRTLAAQARIRAVALGQRRVEIAGRELSLGLLGAAGAGLLLLVGVVLVLSLGSGNSALETPKEATLADRIGEKIGLGPSLDEWMRRAATGDAQAIAELLKRPDSARTSGEWLALGTGQMLLNNSSAGLSAYRSALSLEPRLGSDAALLKNVHRAAREQATSGEALELAAGSLGPSGADLLYALATSDDKQNPELVRRASALLEQSDVAGKASPALRVLLDLRRAKGCPAHKKLLPQVAEHGDERAAQRLKRMLANRRGCGFFGLSDCYGCLRRTELLATATESAERRAAPSFE